MFRKRSGVRVNLVRVCSKPYRCRIDWRGGVLALSRKTGPVATALMDGPRGRKVDRPPWDQDVPRYIIGLLESQDGERFWLCSRSGWFGMEVLADQSGVALLGRTSGGRILMREGFDWRRQDWILAFWLSYAAYKEDEAST